jgi:hypothetical protein
MPFAVAKSEDREAFGISRRSLDLRLRKRLRVQRIYYQYFQQNDLTAPKIYGIFVRPQQSNIKNLEHKRNIVVQAPQASRMWRACLLGAGIGLASLNAASEKITDIRASASSEIKQYKAVNVVDGRISDDSRWVSNAGKAESWLLLEWDKVQALQGLHLFTGWGNKAAIPYLKVDFGVERHFIIEFFGVF